MSAAFAGSSILLGSLAIGVDRTALDRRGRVIGWLAGGAALGLAGVTFPADLPGVDPVSWHATIHDSAYPLIPVCTATAAAICGYREPAGYPSKLVRASRVLAPAMVVAVAATNVDPIAQLSRHFAFSFFAVWLGMLATSLLVSGTDAAVNGRVP
jgi:hypothetical protein